MVPDCLAHASGFPDASVPAYNCSLELARLPTYNAVTSQCRTIQMDHEDTSLLSAFKGYHSKHSHEKRAMAVAAALEVIRADASGGNAEVGDELKSLAKYADQIQKALAD